MQLAVPGLFLACCTTKLLRSVLASNLTHLAAAMPGSSLPGKVAGHHAGQPKCQVSPSSVLCTGTLFAFWAV